MSEPPAPSHPAIEWEPPQLISVENLTGSLGFTPSPDGGVASLLLPDFKVSLDGNDAAPARFCVASLRSRVTVPAGKKLVGFRTDVRGIAIKTKGARVLLVFDLGGRSQTWELPFGKDFGPDHQVDVMRTLSHTGKSLDAYQATLLLCAERQSPAETVLVTIDSLDITPILK